MGMTAIATTVETTGWTEETIQQHPLWPLQVELERSMGLIGADTVQEQVRMAERRSQMTRLDPVRHLLNDWLPFVAKGLREWVIAASAGKAGGPKPIALRYLADIDHATAALVGLRAVLDGMTSNRTAVIGLASKIGRFLEHECQARFWEKKEPKLFRSYQREMDRERVTDRHRAIVNVNRFNHLLATGTFDAGWEPWGEEAHMRVGIEILNTIVRVTDWFEYVDDPEHHYTAKGPKKAARKVVVAKPDLLTWLAEQNHNAEVHHAAFAPTVVPPRRWEGCRKGGYWTPYVRTPRLVRFHVSQEDQRERAADEYDAMEMPQVYDALHFLQEVPWRVNHRVYEVAETIVAKDLRIAGLPSFGLLDLPPKPWAGLTRTKAAEWLKTHPKEHLEWKRAAKPVYRANADAIAKRRMPGRTMRLALEYLHHTFYFPHMMDFRGRMYPIPVGLQPQGDDLARGLLMFAEGKPITAENGGVDWLAIHLASCWGNDKVSFEDRIAWTLEREADWRAVAADPLGNANLWADADKPFQTLACILDWVGYLEEGDGHISHTPVAVDGTCNGIQHLSAMTRDAVAGYHVNLVPSDKPQDIYKFVADNLQAAILEIEKTSCGGREAQAAYWLRTLGREPGTWSRKLTKRQVMVVPYGGSMTAFFEYTREWIMEAIPQLPATNDLHGPTWSTDPKDMTEEQRLGRNGMLTFLAQRMRDVVCASVSGGTEVMAWLQDCARAASGANQPIFWKVATGFVVRHFYGAILEKNVTLKLDGHRTTLKLAQVTDKLDLRSQLRGIPPNFVHSQDAAALTLSINRSRQDGITAFTAVHDAYGTHACDMNSLARRLREAFVELHSDDVLAGFRNACLAVVVDTMVTEDGLEDPSDAYERADDLLPPMPKRGDLDLEGVLMSDYFFA